MCVYVPLRGEVDSRSDDVIVRLDHDGDLAATGRFQDAIQEFEGVL